MNHKDKLNEFTKFKDFNLPEYCRKRCGGILTCPEMMPMNCQIFHQNECLCINICKKAEDQLNTILNRNEY